MHHYYMLYTMNSAQYIVMSTAADLGLDCEHRSKVYAILTLKYFTFQTNEKKQKDELKCHGTCSKQRIDFEI